ncbi:hypothetical protein NZ35_09565 [Pseudomonas chlororaphis]|uniref:Uncharacterized protein n=1 Tax=Pseudomonas chlororaphis TaxID=587753 RepID=A0A0A6DC60_9PSED|nr:hypothetical protein NZ35_09565 [Pseudomonas chlororaphis]
MNDQVTLSEQRTAVNNPDERMNTIPVIKTIKNGNGEYIEPGGTSKSPHLIIDGIVAPVQKVELLRHSIPIGDPVIADGGGNVRFYLANQERGFHEYRLRSSENNVSAGYAVFVDVEEKASISYVTDPEGHLIESGGSTLHSSLSFVGRGVAGTKVKLLVNGKEEQELNVDDRSHWSALVESLVPGSHEFVARGENSQSDPWNILIRESTPISIQFVLGNENFQLIGNHEPTTDRSVTLVGTANPGETGCVVDYHGKLEPFTANQYGFYYVTIENLEANLAHTFRLRSDLYGNRLSEPWAIKVVSSKLR